MKAVRLGPPATRTLEAPHRHLDASRDILRPHLNAPTGHAVQRWFAISPDLLCTANLEGYFTRLNASWEGTLGWTEAELKARPFVEFVHPEDRDATHAEAAKLAEADARTINFQNRYRAKDGSWRWLEWTATSDGQQIYALARDVTERKRAEDEREEFLARVEAMARTDELTGLPNRRAWDEELARELSRAQRKGSPVCVALLDLDCFKSFNDAHGHPGGDALLRGAAVAWRLQSRIMDTVARYGGDEFAVLLPECSIDDALVVVERLRKAAPRGQTCSAGLAQWDGSETAEALISRADAALYAAKRHGRNMCRVAEAE